MIMKRITLLLLVSFGMLSSFASNYEPLIRKDRVWEYYKYFEKEFVQLQFTDSVTYNGNDYVKFTETKVITAGSFKEREVCNTRALMREKDKMVYVLVDNNTLTPIEEISDNVQIKEVKVYDFNSMGFECYGIFNAYTYNNVSIAIRQRYTELNILGNKYAGYEASAVNPKEEAPRSFTLLFAESLGMLRRTGGLFYSDYTKNWVGYLFMPDYSSLPSTTQPAFSQSVHASDKYLRVILNKIYDNKGKVIYEGQNLNSGISDVDVDSGFEIQYKQDKISVNHDGKTNLTLYSLQGTKAAEAKGEGEVSISTSGLVPGLYVARATDADGRTETKKILVR